MECGIRGSVAQHDLAFFVARAECNHLYRNRIHSRRNLHLLVATVAPGECELAHLTVTDYVVEDEDTDRLLTRESEATAEKSLREGS